MQTKHKHTWEGSDLGRAVLGVVVKDGKNAGLALENELEAEIVGLEFDGADVDALLLVQPKLGVEYHRVEKVLQRLVGQVDTQLVGGTNHTGQGTRGRG